MLKDHNAVTPVRLGLESSTTTEPLRSEILFYLTIKDYSGSKFRIVPILKGIQLKRINACLRSLSLI